MLSFPSHVVSFNASDGNNYEISFSFNSLTSFFKKVYVVAKNIIPQAASLVTDIIAPELSAVVDAVELGVDLA